MGLAQPVAGGAQPCRRSGAGFGPTLANVWPERRGVAVPALAGSGRPRAAAAVAGAAPRRSTLAAAGRGQVAGLRAGCVAGASRPGRARLDCRATGARASPDRLPRGAQRPAGWRAAARQRREAARLGAGVGADRIERVRRVRARSHCPRSARERGDCRGRERSAVDDRPRQQGAGVPNRGAVRHHVDAHRTRRGVRTGPASRAGMRSAARRSR